MKDCVGLETAKKLQDAGIYFRNSFRMYCVGCSENKIILRSEIKKYNKLKLRNMICNAPTTNEMLEWLPEIIEHKNVVSKSLDISRIVDLYIVEYADIVDSQKRNSSLQEALAKLCLWVRKEGHK